MNTAQILAAGIALVWLLVRLLKADTLNVVLASYGYAPIPKRLLPWIALIAGVALAVLTECQLKGFTLEAMLAGLVEGLGIGAGATATQELGKGVPGVKKVTSILLLVGFASTTTACGLLTKQNLRSVLDVAQIACIIAHQDLPDSTVANVCDLGDPMFEPMRQVLASSRLSSAKAAAEASERASAKKCAP